MKLEELYLIIKEREKKMPKLSYVTSLLKQGENAILQKIGEEATEVILAGKEKNKQRIIEEITDLYFMTLVFMVSKNIEPEKIYDELEKRNKKTSKITGKF